MAMRLSFHLIVKIVVIVAGYEEITVLRTDPNFDPEQWWAPKRLPQALRFRTTPGECEDTDLPRDTDLRTNSSLPLFTYRVANDLSSPAPEDSDGAQSPYKADPLDKCAVENMALVMEPKVLAFSIEASLLCDPTGKPPYARQFKASYWRAWNQVLRPDSIVSYIAPRNFHTQSTPYKSSAEPGIPSNSTYINALGVLDALSTDLINMMLLRQQTWVFPPEDPRSKNQVPDLGHLEWDAQNDALPPNHRKRIKGGFEDYGYALGINTTIVNVLLAVRDAICLDIGNVSSTNIYTNKTAFNNLIQVEPLFDALLLPKMWQLHPDVMLVSLTQCTWVWGCTRNVNVTWAQELTSTNDPVNNIVLPLDLPSPLPRSVVKMVYICPQYRIKSWGSLMTAVFVGTFTMYLTVREAFTWIASKVKRKRKTPDPNGKYINKDMSGSDDDIPIKLSTPWGLAYTPLNYIPNLAISKEWTSHMRVEESV
ncbi:hypothetical protein RhiLY_12286 [Ceratobasidium sp. AG-Ba]|nr:hypothetical protein RhiLY_12286 [Ceratobasidium sp. AG-Ba]